MRVDLFQRNEMLVYFTLHRYFPDVQITDDLVSAGREGLWRAVIGFDQSRGVRFSTFAVECIRNEILKEMRRERKWRKLLSLDHTSIFDDTDAEGDLILSGIVASDSVDPQDKVAIREELSKMSSREKKLIFLRALGYTQQEIARMIGHSQAHVSRTLSGICKKFNKGECAVV